MKSSEAMILVLSFLLSCLRLSYSTGFSSKHLECDLCKLPSSHFYSNESDKLNSYLKITFCNRRS